MKSITHVIRNVIFASALCMAAENSFCQSFVFSNTGVNGGARAAVFGPDVDNPYRQGWGNTLDAMPPGAQTYSGSPLLGTNYNVQAWYSLTPVPNTFALLEGAAPVAGSLTFFPLSGFFSRGDRSIPGAPLSGVSLQVRAWDNGNGLYATWDEAYNAAVGGSGLAVGWSKTFAQPLDVGSVPYPGMMNFESFNLFIVPIPEPSLAVLALLGGAVLFASTRIRGRYRRQRR